MHSLTTVGQLRQELLRKDERDKILRVDKLLPHAFKTNTLPTRAGRRALGSNGRSQVGTVDVRNRLALRRTQCPPLVARITSLCTL